MSDPVSITITTPKQSTVISVDATGASRVVFIGPPVPVPGPGKPPAPPTPVDPPPTKPKPPDRWIGPPVPVPPIPTK
jgi:hypothetical protein